LQQKHGFHGGVDHCGPYVDELADETGTSPGPHVADDIRSIRTIPPKLAAHSVIVAGGGTPRGTMSSLKRKSSFSGREIDATGGASHIGAVLYPAHYCAPLQVPSRETLASMPYGKHAQTPMDATIPSDDIRSTKPIDWSSIVNMFKPVAVQESTDSDQKEEAGVPSIFAPFVKKLKKPAWDSESTEESDSGDERGVRETGAEAEEKDDGEGEEDISDAAVLDRHKTVLAAMKEKMDAATEEQRSTRNRSVRAL
jgi:hypothetical protein